MPNALSTAFVQALPGGRRASFMALADLDGRIEALLERARGAHPGVVVDDTVFLRHAARCLDEDADPEALAALHADDLYLACASALGDDAAVREIRKRWSPAIRHVVRRCGPAEHVDDLCQQIWAKLLVGDGKPALASYGGRGKLSTWLQSVATRHVLSFLRSREARPAADEDALERAIDADDPALEALKRRYRGEFKRAFQEAFRRLSPRQRNLLRHEFIDGLNIDRLGALYGVHRATAARWRAEARRALLEATRALFQEENRVSSTEMDSIQQLIASQLEVSITRLLGRRKGG
jgi:RNA polymerase sigma-70 factor (ECF subfamily)